VKKTFFFPNKENNILNVQHYRSFILLKVSAIRPYQEGYNFYYISNFFTQIKSEYLKNDIDNNL